jgi:Tfp pilus assembly protein PilF
VTRFEQGYREIASATRIPGRDDPKNNILQLVYDWLRDEENGHWLMVLDNADDHHVFFDTMVENKPLADYLPQKPHGSILITSRNRMAVQNLVGSQSNLVLVEPMGADDAVALLRTCIHGDQSSETEKRELVKALEYIPLAISQAGAYIASRSPRMTVSTYLELFRQSESSQEHLLNYDGAKDLRRDRSIRHSVITTWQISFDQIRSTCPAATDLLALMSMFDRQGIPEDLVNQHKDRLEFEDAMAPLMSFSLIRTEIGEQSFEMHRLVQLSIRQWLKREQQLERLAKESRNVMEKIFPSGEYETWTTCQMLLPHVQAVIWLIVDLDKEDQSKAMRITNRCGWYLTHMGKYQEAEAMHRRALVASKKVLGAEHPDTLISINSLGLVLNRQGEYDEAEMMHRRALVAREKVLGAEHPSTLISVNNLGLVLDRQGKYDKAEVIHRRALKGYEKVLGAEHPETLISVSNLGYVLDSQRKYDEAEAMHQRALVAREKVLGAEHPSTLISVSNLGLVLDRQGKYDEAEVMHRRALKGYEKVLGAEHPETLASVSNLGYVLNRQGKYDEAEAMYQRALVAREKVLGAEHPSTLASVNNLGNVLNSQGKYEEANEKH